MKQKENKKLGTASSRLIKKKEKFYVRKFDSEDINFVHINGIIPTIAIGASNRPFNFEVINYSYMFHKSMIWKIPRNSLSSSKL